MRNLFLKILSMLHLALDRAHSEYLKSRMACGKGVIVRENALIYCPERVTLADGVMVGNRVTIMAQGGVEIGANTLLGPGVTILTVNHDFTKPRPDGRSTLRKRPVKIGRDVFIAGGALILPGVKVGDGSAIAAGAVVNSDVPENSIVAGNPARLIRERFRPKESTAPLFEGISDSKPEGAVEPEPEHEEQEEEVGL